MWKLVWNFVKSHLLDKAMWVTVLTMVTQGLQNGASWKTIVWGLGTYAVTHLVHSNTVSKDNTNA